jgi:hypothetical protein
MAGKAARPNLRYKRLFPRVETGTKRVSVWVELAGLSLTSLVSRFNPMKFRLGGRNDGTNGLL